MKDRDGHKKTQLKKEIAAENAQNTKMLTTDYTDYTDLRQKN